MNSTVPALVYLAARTRRTAASHIAVRVSGSSRGAGLSSTSFWCRRCIVQSRSQRWTTLP